MSEKIQNDGSAVPVKDAAPENGGPARVEPFRLPKANAIGALAKQLQAQFGMTAAAAEAIANAVEDPAEARRQIQTPGRVRVPRGSLRTITARLSAFNVIPHLVNGRVVGATPYPASVHAGQAPSKFWAERDIRALNNSELVLKADSKQDVIDAMVDMSRELLAQNDLSASVREVGVYFPIVVVPMTIETGDGPSRTVLSGAEGSSRISTTHRINGVSAADILFGTLAEPRAARQRMSEVMAKLALPLDAVTEEDLQKARAASLPATIIVGFEPDSGGGDLRNAVDEYVAFLHLDPPKEWTEPAKENKLADAVVDELVSASELSEAEAAWFAGMLSPADAEAASLPGSADERSARILRKLSAPAGSVAGAAVGRGTKRFTLQERASRYPKSTAAASLALRAFPSTRKATTTILARAWSYKPFWNNTWSATARPLDELRDAALAELEASRPGPNALELATRASYWLVTAGALGAPEPGSNVRTAIGDGLRSSDKRYADQVLDATLRVPRGIHFLYQAAVTGRLGSPPPQVDERGTVVVSAAGSPIVATSAWVRETFRPPAASASPSPTPPSPPVPTPTPEHALDAAITVLEADVDAVVMRMREIESIPGPGGGSFVGVVGIDAPRARDLTTKLEGITRSINRFELVWENANPDLVESDDEDDGDDEHDGGGQ